MVRKVIVRFFFYVAGVYVWTVSSDLGGEDVQIAKRGCPCNNSHLYTCRYTEPVGNAIVMLLRSAKRSVVIASINAYLRPEVHPGEMVSGQARLSTVEVGVGGWQINFPYNNAREVIFRLSRKKGSDPQGASARFKVQLIREQL